MEEEVLMEFQLTQAKLRGAIGAFTLVATIMLPIFGWQVVRYVDNLKELGTDLGAISTQVAVLAAQVTALQADVSIIEAHMREPLVRPGNYVIPQYPITGNLSVSEKL